MIATMERLRTRREELDGQGGFTLIELLIVVVILGILAAIVVFAVNNLTGTSAKSACQSDVSTVDRAVQIYYGQNASAYPANVAALVGTGSNAYLHTTPINAGHYAIEMDKNVTASTGGTTTYSQAANTGGTAGQIDVLSGWNGTAWTGKTALSASGSTSASSAAALACTSVS